MVVRVKIEEADVDGYDWNWNAKYLEEFVEDLTKAYIASFQSEFPDSPIGRAGPVPLNVLQREAAEWAMEHGAEQIEAITTETKSRVRHLVRSGIMSGHPVGRIANMVQGDFIFSVLRAARIARTETAIALGQGAIGAAKAQGRDQKRWITQGDDLVSDECRTNERVSWIGIADSFPTGVSTIPQHPNCRCNVRYRTKELHTPDTGPPIVETGLRSDFRCTGCNRLLARNAPNGVRIHCRHCKQEREA